MRRGTVSCGLNVLDRNQSPSVSRKPREVCEKVTLQKILGRNHTATLACFHILCRGAGLFESVTTQQVDNPGRPIWILTGCLSVFGLVTCLGIGMFVALFPPQNTPAPSGLANAPTSPQRAAGVDLGPRKFDAVVTAVSGSAPVSVGAGCSVQIVGAPLAQGLYWCNAQLFCGGRLLYGGASAGYFDCSLSGPPGRHVLGHDQQTTAADSDAAFAVDTVGALLRVRDDANGMYGTYSIDARISQPRR